MRNRPSPGSLQGSLRLSCTSTEMAGALGQLLVKLINSAFGCLWLFLLYDVRFLFLSRQPAGIFRNSYGADWGL